MLAWHHPSSFQSKLGKGRQVRHTVSDILLWISLFRGCIITRDKTLGELQISRRKWCWETEHSESQELQIVQHRVKTPLLLRLMSRQALYIPRPPTIRTLANKPYSLAALSLSGSCAFAEVWLWLLIPGFPADGWYLSFCSTAVPAQGYQFSLYRNL